MNNKLDTLLENEIKRFNSIIAYQDKMSLSEGAYRFYNEAEEETQGGTSPQTDGTEQAPVDNAEAPTTDSTEEMPVDGTEIPTTDSTEQAPVDNAEAPANEDVTEIDVTDLVNDTNEIKGKISSIEGNLTKIDSIMSKVDNLANNVTKMDDLIGKMEQLAKQVELMRPPTEDERRKALAKDSYPYSVTIDQYNNGQGVKTQSELENRSNKMSMMDTLLSDYNDSVVRDSFYVPQNNPLMSK